MPIPNPEPGLVISYAYLWHHEHQAGREEGQKDRPSVIVLAIEREADGATVATVLPITHSAPPIRLRRLRSRYRSNGISGSTRIVHGSLSTKAMNFCGPATTCASFLTAIAMTTASCRRDFSIRCSRPSSPIVALTYASAIDDPGRFRSSKAVGALFGLPPENINRAKPT